MNLTTGKTYAFCILLAQAVGALSAWVTREGVERFNACVQKPPLTPPSAVFPVVWTILFALMGVGAARVALSPPSRQRQRALALFLLQLGRYPFHLPAPVTPPRKPNYPLAELSPPSPSPAFHRGTPPAVE